MTLQSTLHCTIFFVLSQEVQIAETRLKAVLEDINKMFFIKTILEQLMLI